MLTLRAGTSAQGWLVNTQMCTRECYGAGRQCPKIGGSAALSPELCPLFVPPSGAKGGRSLPAERQRNREVWAFGLPDENILEPYARRGMIVAWHAYELARPWMSR